MKKRSQRRGLSIWDIRADIREGLDSPDFDIAVKATPLRMPAWTRLQGDLQDEPITLYQVDLVDYNELSDEYKKRISREGKLLYARQSK